MGANFHGKIKLVRITTAPISMRLLITGQPAYMKQCGFDVTLVSAEGEDWNHIPSLQDYNVVKVDMARQIDIGKDVRSLLTLIKLFRKVKPHIVHSHTPKAGLLAMVAAKVAGVPVRVHTLAGMPLMTATGLKRSVLFQAEKLTFAASHETWVNSKQLLGFIQQHHMINPSKAVMILNGSSNGIDLSRFSVDAINWRRVEEIKNTYHIKPDHFCFLAVGRMVNDKGIKELVESFVDIYNKNSKVRMFLLGPFEKADELPATIQDVILSHPGIIHISWSDEVENFMAFTHCFVHASHREGFPNVVLQAAAMGTPIICSNIPGNIDIVEHEGEGTIYQVKSQQQLSECMSRVMNNYDEAKAKAKMLCNKVVSNFDRRNVHKAIKQRYIHLLKQKNIDVSSIN